MAKKHLARPLPASSNERHANTEDTEDTEERRHAGDDAENPGMTIAERLIRTGPPRRSCGAAGQDLLHHRKSGGFFERRGTLAGCLRGVAMGGGQRAERARRSRRHGPPDGGPPGTLRPPRTHAAHTPGLPGCVRGPVRVRTADEEWRGSREIPQPDRIEPARPGRALSDHFVSYRA